MPSAMSTRTESTTRRKHPKGTVAHVMSPSSQRFPWTDPTVSVEKRTRGKSSGTCESHTPCGLQAQPPGSFAGGGFLVLVEPREIHAPDVAVTWRQRASVRHRERLERAPRDAQFDGPPAIAIAVVVDRAVDMDCRRQARHVPVPVADPRSARMVLEADAAEGPHAIARAVELGAARVARRFERLLPDEEDLVDRAEALISNS